MHSSSRSPLCMTWSHSCRHIPAARCFGGGGGFEVFYLSCLCTDAPPGGPGLRRNELTVSTVTVWRPLKLGKDIAAFVGTCICSQFTAFQSQSRSTQGVYYIYICYITLPNIVSPEPLPETSLPYSSSSHTMLETSHLNSSS